MGLGIHLGYVISSWTSFVDMILIHPQLHNNMSAKRRPQVVLLNDPVLSTVCNKKKLGLRCDGTPWKVSAGIKPASDALTLMTFFCTLCARRLLSQKRNRGTIRDQSTSHLPVPAPCILRNPWNQIIVLWNQIQALVLPMALVQSLICHLGCISEIISHSHDQEATELAPSLTCHLGFILEITRCNHDQEVSGHIIFIKAWTHP